MSSSNTKPKTTECNNVGPPLYPSDQWVPVGTGNYYKGNWNHRTMSGSGVYVMLNESIYKGDFEDGLFHGAGTIYYPTGCWVDGVWERGKCVERNYIFRDGLRFRPKNWQYCKMPDRRFAIEHVNGLEPAAKSLITNRQPTIEVPLGAYDTGDGFYQPLTNTVHNYWTNELIRVPTVEGAKWIMENCRQGGVKIVGFRPDLHENWYNTTMENLYSDLENNDQPIMTDVKSVPASAFDLCLNNLRLERRESYSLDQLPTSSTWLDCRPKYCKKTVLINQVKQHRSSFSKKRLLSSTLDQL